MSDLIDREQAIKAMDSWDWQELYLPIHFKQLLEELPSVGCWVPYPLFEPADYGEYLIAVQEDGVLHYDLGDWSEYTGSGGIHGACWITQNDWNEARQIVAWCALPALPKK